VKRTQVIFCCIFLLAIQLCVGCSEESKVEPGVYPSSGKDIPSQVSYHTTIRFTNDGKLRAILLAGRIRTYDEKHNTLLDSSVKVDFYDKLGFHSSILTSKGATVDNASNNMQAYDSVHIVSDSGEIVDTDTLYWDNQKQLIHSDDPVRIVEPSGRITTGIGFVSDQNLTHYSIMHTTIDAPQGAFEDNSKTTTSSMPQKGPSPFGTTSPFAPTSVSPPAIIHTDSSPKPKPDTTKK
jgi:LPS export ABC transporter protein LptC